MKKLFIVALLTFSSWVGAQEKIIIIENNLAELGTFDKYNLHTYTKQFLVKEGYSVYFENEIPKEYVNNRCGAKYVNFKDTSNMLTTKLIMQLKDCSGKILFETHEAKSKEKIYQTAYREVFRLSAKDFTQKKELIDKFFTTQETEYLPNVTTPETKNTTVLVQPQTAKNLNFVFENNNNEGVLKDLTGKTLYKITKTSVENLYMASNNYVDGIIYTKEGKWYFEFTKNGNKIIEEIK